MRPKTILKACIAATVAVAISQGLNGCSGCGRSAEQESAVRTADSLDQITAIDILAIPGRHDATELHRYARAIEADDAFDAADMATMITLSEGSLQHLDQEVENLLRNDDAADSYNVLSELAEAQWTADLSRIIRFLHKVPLPDAMLQRHTAAFALAARINTQISAIEAEQLNGRKVMHLAIENTNETD